MSKLTRQLEAVALDARLIANARIRALFTQAPMGSSAPLADSDLGRKYVDARSEGREFAAILGAVWTPVQWLRNRGFTYEINSFDFAMMGQSALDPAIDDAVESAVMDAITANPGFIGELVRDVLTRKSPSKLYTIEGQ